MDKLSLDIQDSALLIIDLQEKLMAVMRNRDEVCRCTNVLLALFKECKAPILVTEQYPKGLGATVNEVRKNLNDFIYIEKNSFSAYTQDMEKFLQCLKKKTLILTGCETHILCLSDHSRSCQWRVQRSFGPGCIEFS